VPGAKFADTFYRLRSIPGVGKILALVLLYEIHDIQRFASEGMFLSYARLIRPQKSHWAGAEAICGKRCPTCVGNETACQVCGHSGVAGAIWRS